MIDLRFSGRCFTMSRFLTIASILIVVALTVKAQEHSSTPTQPATPANASSWVTVSSEEGQFSVLFPEAVEDQSKTEQSTKGPYTTHLFVAKTSKGVFLVGWVDYDPSFNFGVQSELEANRDNFVKGVSATLVSTSKITFNGHPGLQFTAETPDVVFRSRVYIIGRRPYQLIAGTRKGQNDSENVARFFESFQLKLP
jgi:hypothetical protein